MVQPTLAPMPQTVAWDVWVTRHLLITSGTVK